jgi:SH3-like domain-containing protein
MQHAIKQIIATTIAVLLSLITLGTAHAQVTERVKVADPYLEMRTGPGRGFPVHHVAARHEFVFIELRHTDWFKVRTASDTGNEKTGWVHRRQLATTLTEAGVAKTFRDTALDDYLLRRVQIGAAYGRFSGEPMQKIWMSYRLSDALSFEGSIAQVQGVFSGTDMWYGNLLAEPWSDQRLSPFLGIGIGRFRNFPNQSLVGATDTDANLANATFGVRYYLSERFVLRADYTLYTAFVSDQRSQEFRAVTAGISFFFY